MEMYYQVAYYRLFPTACSCFSTAIPHTAKSWDPGILQNPILEIPGLQILDPVGAWTAKETRFVIFHLLNNQYKTFFIGPWDGNSRH